MTTKHKTSTRKKPALPNPERTLRGAPICSCCEERPAIMGAVETDEVDIHLGTAKALVWWFYCDKCTPSPDWYKEWHTSRPRGVKRERIHRICPNEKDLLAIHERVGGES